MKHLILFATLVTVALFVCAPTADAQSKSCADMRSGEYYYYPRNTLQRYHVIVSGEMEKVVDMNKRMGSSHYDSWLIT